MEALLKEEGLMKENEPSAKEQLRQNFEKVKKEKIDEKSDDEAEKTAEVA